ncbi:MAG: LytTR family DNA-binding domain-containing protein [Bacteroidales bacterium]|nr:LytTR family DNA-binding domain-containing protein [Bacteroidales bacterium]
MKRLACIAVDDEPPALEKLEKFICKVQFLKLTGKFTSGLEAIEFIQNKRVDLMFLDIHMEDISGLQVIDTLSRKPIIILTTAYDSYAVRGFELNVCDYLLKPFDFERFLQASTKALNQYIAFTSGGAVQSPDVETKPNPREYIFIKTSYKYKRVKIDDILYLQGMRDYIMIHTTGGKIMTLTSFAELERVLPQDRFFRIHKSYVVAINKVDAIDRKRAVIGKEYLPISNTYYDGFIMFLRNNSILSS